MCDNICAYSDLPRCPVVGFGCPLNGSFRDVRSRVGELDGSARKANAVYALTTEQSIRPNRTRAWRIIRQRSYRRRTRIVSRWCGGSAEAASAWACDTGSSRVPVRRIPSGT